MSVRHLTLSQSKVQQRIEFSELFKVDISAYPALKERIGQAIIDYMRARTERGVDVNGNRFLPYSKSYKKSREYRAYDKNSKVDMELSGGMLTMMDILSIRGNGIVIGWDGRTNQVEMLKAYNHNVGDTVPKRQFFGVTERDLKKIIAPFESEIKRIETRQVQELRRGAAQLTVGDVLNPIERDPYLLDLWDDFFGDSDGNN